MGTMGSPGTDLARGYVQHRLEGDQIPEESAQQIIQVADQVLMAGMWQWAMPGLLNSEFVPRRDQDAIVRRAREAMRFEAPFALGGALLRRVENSWRGKLRRTIPAPFLIS
jgi:hypothetical protein